MGESGSAVRFHGFVLDNFPFFLMALALDSARVGYPADVVGADNHAFL